jgi:hypothetical protein
MQGEEVSIEELASNLSTYKEQLHQVPFLLFLYFRDYCELVPRIRDFFFVSFVNLGLVKSNFEV